MRSGHPEAGGAGGLMGYPMVWPRVIARNRLTGGYADSPVAGDMRRLERDSRDAHHVARFARRAGITAEQARSVLDDFFDGVSAGCAAPGRDEPCDGSCGAEPLNLTIDEGSRPR